MKIVLKLMMMMMGMAVMYSCSSTQDVVVKGTPGTKIYSPTNYELGVVGSEGEVKVKVPMMDNFYAYLLSQKPGDNKKVPFAMNYKHSGNEGGGKAALAGGLTLATIGLGVVVTAVAVNSENPDPDLLLGGGIAVAGGMLIGGIGQLFLDRNNWGYEYRYLSYQKTNEDLAFTPIVDTGYSKDDVMSDSPVAAAPSRRAKGATSASSESDQSSTSNRRIKKDLTKSVVGTYIGSGSLLQKGKLVEEYDVVKVLITRVDNANVWIDVVEGGESFFSSKIQCQVTKKGRSTYVLTLKGVPGASITIDNSGTLTFKHPKVNIDGELYTLNITAEQN